MPAISAHSAKTWRARLARLAPSAARTASSRERAVFSVSRRFVAFVTAINSRNAVPAASSSKALRTGAAIASASGVMPNAAASVSRPNCWRSRVASAFAARRALPRSSMLLSRASADQLCALRDVPGSSSIGIHAALFSGNAKPGGITPMIVAVSPVMAICWPSTSTRPCSRLCHSVCEITATWSCSFLSNVRPSAGAVPSTWKKSPPTIVPSARFALSPLETGPSPLA